MMVTGALLFLLGTSVSAGPFLPSLPKEIIIGKHGSEELAVVPSSRSSVIENYIQEGTNVFFKPQFILSADKMPPQLQPLITAIENDDCKTQIHPMVAPVIVDESLRVVEQKINAPLMQKIEHITDIKPAALLPVLPEVHVAKPVEITITEEVKPLIVEEPVMHIPEIVEIREPVMAVEIPHGPVLPPMEPPRLPVLIEETPMVVEVPHEHPTRIFMEIEEHLPVVVPPAPLLPPMEIARVPVLVEESPIVKVEEENEIKVPIMIPPGPVLPPMEMPVPVIVEETPYVTDVSIPPGPVLPPAELPKLPVMVEHASPIAVLPCEHTVPLAPAFVDVEMPKEVKVPLVVPPAPVLPPMEMQLAPVVVKEPLHVEKPMQMVPFAHVLSPVVMHEIHHKEPAEIVTPVAYHAPIVQFTEMGRPTYIEQNRFVLPAGIPMPIHIPEVPQMMSSIPKFSTTKHCVDEIIEERLLPIMEKGVFTVPAEIPVPYYFPLK